MASDKSTERPTLVIGTRGSALALWQAEWVQARLHALAPTVRITLKTIKTSGDKITDVPLAAIGGKGLFVKEIEEALLREEIDLAVHSMKDVPTVLPDRLTLVAVPAREDSRDVLISRSGLTLATLPSGARIGTSSLRRQAQLLHRRADLVVEMLRGNLDTRLRKAREGTYDAVVVAAAGLNRLGWAEHVTEYLSAEVSLPAVGQGALGIEGRRDDLFVSRLAQGLDDAPTRIAVTAERAFLERLEGGCQVPIAAHASVSGATLTLDGLVASVDGRRLLREAMEGTVAEAKAVGVAVAERLLRRGGADILREIYVRA
jgi:hydroxymethylbilane synthase